MPLRYRPCLEPLEDRTVPSTFGVAWLDARHLSLSFVPDGTQVGKQSSNLFQLLNTQLGVPASVWETELLRAVQQWTSVANIDVGVVADGGQALGAPGQLHADPRFGDIRIAAAPMSGAGVAIATPYDATAGTLAGDIVLNSSYAFRMGGAPGGFDLYTMMMHEMGHVLGLDHIADPNSVMADKYTGPRAGLAAGDVAAVQNLYDARMPDAHEMLSTSSGSAAPMPITDGSGNYAAPVVEGEISTQGGRDLYQFTTTGTALSATVAIQTSGISTLTPLVTIYDAGMNPLATFSSTNPLNGDNSTHLTFQAGSTYYIAVQSSTSGAFAIGSYHLKLHPDQASGTASSMVRADAHSDDTIAGASSLAAAASITGVRQMYEYRASISDSNDADYYHVVAPTNPNGTHDVLTISARGLESSGLDPMVVVYTANGKQVKSTKVLAHQNGTYTIQVPDAVPATDYFVSVKACNPSGALNVGNYSLSMDFRSPAVRMIVLDAGVMQDTSLDNSVSPTAFAELELDLQVPMTIQFVLSVWQDPNSSASTGNPTPDQAIQMTLTDSSGNVIATLTTLAGQSQSVTMVLPAGTYFITLTCLETSVTEPPLDFELDAVILSQPLGTTAQGGSSTYTTSGGKSQL